MNARLPLLSPGYLGRSPNIDAQRMVNLVAEKADGGKDVVALYLTPGLEVWTTVGSAPLRGMHTFNGLLYVVSGGKLYSVTPAKIISSALGTLSTSNGRVVMRDNSLSPTGGNQLAIADGTDLYIYNVSTGVFAAQGIPTATVTFINGKFVAPIGGGQFQVSGVYDGTSWNSLDKSTADSFPDNLVTCRNISGQLWLVGEYTTEPWYDDPLNADGSAHHPPFSRYQGALVNYGTPAPHSFAKGDNSAYWLASEADNNEAHLVGVVRANGYTPQIITPASIVTQWQQYSTVADAWAFMFSLEGHTFYRITFPTANATWQYDASMGFLSTSNGWSEVSSYVSAPYAIGRHLGNCYANLNGMMLLGSYMDGTIYRMSSGLYQDADGNIAWDKIFQHLVEPGGKTVFYHGITVDAEVGGTADPADEPKVQLRWSDDGGHTWGNWCEASLGKQGEYRRRLTWNGLGSGRDRVFWLHGSGNCRTVLTGASADFTVGTI